MKYQTPAKFLCDLFKEYSKNKMFIHFEITVINVSGWFKWTRLISQIALAFVSSIALLNSQSESWRIDRLFQSANQRM